MSLHLTTDVPYGNACDVLITERDGVSVVEFAPDPHGGPECLWFCFRLVRSSDGTTAGESVQLVLKHPENALGLADERTLRPVMRSDGGDWERLEAGARTTFPDGRSVISWTVAAPEKVADVALCYPYGYGEVETLVAESEGALRSDVIGVSQGGRPMVRLSNRYGSTDSAREPGLYLVARQHSAETSGSWVLDGFLRRIAEQGDDAPLVWAIPLLNPDGVLRGDYGKDNFPYDLNRAWGRPPMRHEIMVAVSDIRRWAERCAPTLGMDFHSPGGTEATGIYAFVPKPEESVHEHARACRWANAAAAGLGPEYADPEFCRVARYASRWETPSSAGYFRTRTEACGLTFETPYAMVRDLVLTRERYREAGRRIADAVVDEIRKTR